MTLKLGSLFYDFNADTSKLKRKQKEIQDTNKKVTKSFVTVGRAITAAFSLEVLRRALRMVDNMTLLRGRVDNLTKSQKESNKLFRDLIKLSDDLGVTIDGTVQSFQRFSLVKDVIGASNDQVLQFTENIQKLGIVSGATGQEITSTSIQIGQAIANNFTSAAQEINSINEQMPEVARAVERSLGLIPGSFKKAVTEGQVSAEQFFNAILEQTDNIEARFINLPITIARASTEFSNTLAKALQDFDDMVGVTDLIVDNIKSASKIMRNDFLTTSQSVLEVFKTIRAVSRQVFSISFFPDLNFDMVKSRKLLTDWLNDIIVFPVRLRAIFTVLFSQMDIFIIKAVAIFEKLGVEWDRQMDFLGRNSQEFFDEQLLSIDKNRNAQIKASKEVAQAEVVATELKIKKINEESAARKKAIEIESAARKKARDVIDPTTADRTVAGGGGPEIIPVSGADKIRAQMGDETQIILNQLQERNNKILELTKVSEEERRALLVESGRIATEQFKQNEQNRQQTALDSLSQFNDAFLGLLEAAGKEQSALGKAAFLASKALAVANIIVSTQQGAAQALALGPAGIPLAALIEGLGFTSAGIVAGTAVAQTFSGGGRQAGGPAFAGALHPVNESGGPEIFQQGARQFLMPGSKSGTVMPLNAANDGGGVVININNSAPGLDISATTLSTGEIDIRIKRAEDNAVNRVNTSLSQGRGPSATAINSGFKMERNIR